MTGTIIGDYFLLVMLIVFFLAPLIAGVRKLSFARRIADTPTSRIDSLSAGLVEVKGHVVSKTIYSPVSNMPCAYWMVEVYNSMREKDVYKASSADKLLIDDGSGKIRVDLSRAELSLVTSWNTAISLPIAVPSDETQKKAIEFLKDKRFNSFRGPLGYISVKEAIIPPGQEIYVLGDAEPAADSGLIIRKAEPDNVLFISESDEKKAIKDQERAGYLRIGLGILLLVLFSVFFFVPFILAGLTSGNTVTRPLIDIQTAIASAAVLAGISIPVALHMQTVYNRLVILRNKTDKAWADIDVCLKQRFDLVPGLEKAVKGYMKHERSLLVRLTELRSSISSVSGPAEKATIDQEAENLIKKIFSVVESYPQLKSSEQVLEFQRQLTDLENKIADKREVYNHCVYLYNTRIASFPDSLLSIPLRMRARKYFKA